MPLMVIVRSKNLFQARSGIKFGESLASILHFIQQIPDSPSLILRASMRQILI